MTRAVLPTPATPSYCAAMTVGTMVKRFAHVRFLVDCLWVQLLFTLSVPRDIFRTPALIWGRFIDSGNQVGRTRSDIQAAGPRRCQSQIVLLLLGCKAGFFDLPMTDLGAIHSYHGSYHSWKCNGTLQQGVSSNQKIRLYTLNPIPFTRLTPPHSVQRSLPNSNVPHRLDHPHPSPMFTLHLRSTPMAFPFTPTLSLLRSLGPQVIIY